MKLSGDKCRCAACGALFASTWSFDRHRHGSYTGRRCFDLKSMKQAGFSQDSSGFLRVPG